MTETINARIYDLAPIGIAFIEKNTVTYANPLFTAMKGNAVLTHETVLEHLEQGKDMPPLDMELEARWVRATISHTDKTAILWLTDISEIKQAAAEAKIMMEMKSSFLASMSHEIRTPMQSVYGLLELVYDEPINSEAKDMITTARKSASGLLEILDDILDLAKVEAGKTELDYFEIPLRTLAYGVMECMEVKLLGKPVKMLTEVEKEIPFVVMGDPTRLRQIMLNLVGNAMKFTDKGTITLRINTQVKAIPVPKEGFALRFEIEDTGIGMPPSVAQKLFQAFVQADNSTTRKYGGTGLGLSISHKLVELMGGKIGVDSTEGKGSIFWFEIPTAAADEQVKVELPNLDGLAVLSVEDHPKGAKEILHSLTSMGAKVESVATYAEGLDLIKKRPFDVAVIDQGLPDGLGVDLLKEAVKIRPFMGLILYTVRNDLGMQYTAKTVGAKYLSKPASRLGLGEAVKAAAKQMSLQDYTGPRRLLIAEDTVTVQDVLQRQLNKLGVEADFVTNGVEALRMLEKKEHGILFTDLHMPEMDGYELVAAIRAAEDGTTDDENNRRFPVIVLTADVQMAQRQAYLAHGFDECLLKPVSLGQFKQLLIRWGVLQEKDATAVIADASPPPIIENTQSAVDKNMIVQQMGALDADTIEMLKMFVTMTGTTIDKIEAAFAQNNIHDLGELGHSLKGAARSACCPVLGNLAADLQDFAAKGTPITHELITAIKAEFLRVGAEINQLKPQ
jgi:signal transduction histidine kinase/DNA-binding response OmpR family regulator